MPTPGSSPRTRPLEVASCRRECSWARTAEQLDGEPVFACAGCGSEWVPSEPWTPAEWTGEVPEAVRQAVQRFRGRDSRRGRG